MNRYDFLRDVKLFIVPPEPPDGTSEDGWSSDKVSYRDPLPDYTLRKECTHRGMWPITTVSLAKDLAVWLDGRSVLEIMSGAGWLASALMAINVPIIATDNYSWNDKHELMKPLCEIKKLEATAAVRKFSDKADALLVSWPPYGDDAICRASEAWGTDRPILYIGESDGGCNAPDEFFDHFSFERAPIPLMSWYGIHDHVFVGNYVTESLGTF